jgi:hypothetical protein
VVKRLLEFEDPLTGMVNPLIIQLEEALKGVQVLARYRKPLSSEEELLIEKTSCVKAIYDFGSAWRYTSDEMRMSTLLEELDDFKHKVELALESLNKAAGALKRDAMVPDLDKNMAGAEADYAEILRLLDALTPAQLAMQKHFLWLVQTVSIENASYMNELLVPLEKLRNDLFLEPRAGIVAEYLERVAQLRLDRLFEYSRNIYKEYLSRSHFVDVEEEALEQLEVMSLLEVIER